MRRLLASLFLFVPTLALGNSIELRQDTVDGKAVSTVNDNFRRLSQEKLDKRQVEALVDVAITTRATRYAIFTDEKSLGTAGGAFNSGSWVTRTLNSSSVNIAGASVTASTITLPAGRYVARIWAPAYRVDRHQAVLYDVTNATERVRGTVAYSGSGGDYAQTLSLGMSTFELTSSSQLILRHRCETTRATNGLGLPGSFTTEQYSYVEIWELGG